VFDANVDVVPKMAMVRIITSVKEENAFNPEIKERYERLLTYL
jgi:hypothetical protein